MARILVKGPTPLKGSLNCSGAKNACLPILAATILAKGKVKLKRVPNISDVHTMLGILQGMGVKYEWVGPEELDMDTSSVITTAPEDLAKQDDSRVKVRRVPFPVLRRLPADFD